MRSVPLFFPVFVLLAGCATPKLAEPAVAPVPTVVPAVRSRVESSDVAAGAAMESGQGLSALLDPPHATLVCEARVHVVPAYASPSGEAMRVHAHDVEGCGRGTVRARLVNRTPETVTITEATVAVSRASRSVEGFAYWLDWSLAPGESRVLSVPVREPGTLTVSFRVEGAGETPRVSASSTIERVQVVVER
jgi:hypothetical protein